ncbi:hypothetical protein D3C86_1359790 [compost metagenome]
MQGLQGVAIGDVAGTGDGHAIAGLEAHHQGQHQGGGCARRHDHPLGIDGDVVAVVIELGDARAQGRAFPVAAGLAVQNAVGLGDGGGGGAGRGLAELHMDDGAALGLQLMSQAADADSAEGVDVYCGHRRAIFPGRRPVAIKNRNKAASPTASRPPAIWGF